MKKKLLSFIIVLTTLNTLQSQNFDWAKSFGSTGNDIGTGITVDISGNVITVGNFSNTVDFDPTVTGTQTLSSVPGGGGMFISKLSSAGNLLWAKSFDGPSDYNLIKGVDTDANGNIYVIGEFGAVTDFDPAPNATFTLAPSGPTDMFVSKLDASGNFVWAFQVGGTNNSEFCHSITVDASGNVYMMGSFSQSVDFDPSAGIGTLTSIGGGDAFIAKYTSAGLYVWVGRIGGGGGATGGGITVDAAQNIYATGWFNGIADMDPAPATTFTFASMGAQDLFVCKLDASCNFVWAKQIGGSGQDLPKAIAHDANSNIYITGSFDTTADFDPSAVTYPLTANAGQDLFICKLDANGAFVWAHSFGSATQDNDSGLSIAVSPQGNIFTTGGFYGSVDFDPSSTTTTILSALGGIDTFVSKLDGNGNFVWAKQLSGNSYDLGQSIAVDASENVYTTGGFYSVVDYNPSPSATHTLASAGLYDAFVSKLKVEETSPVGISGNNTLNHLVSLYPNPTNGVLTVNTNSYENTHVAIYNITGQKIMRIKLLDRSTIIDFGNLSQGIYQVELFQDDVRFYQSKIIRIDN